jgi:hypothetical protein
MKTYGCETRNCLMAANGMSRVADATYAAMPLSGLAVEGFEAFFALCRGFLW